MKNINVDSIKELREVLCKESNVIINLKKGVYETDETLYIRNNNVTLNGNGAVIKGSKKIDLSGMEKENGIVKIVLSEYGINNTSCFGLGSFWGANFECERDSFGTALNFSVYSPDQKPYDAETGPGMEVFFDGKKMSLSRYPDDGYMLIDEVIEKDGKIYLKPDDDKFAKMKYAENAMLCGYWKFNWAYQRHMIDSVDAEENVLEIQPPYHGFGYVNKEERTEENGYFYAINVYEMLDRPGNWYIDRENGVLYVHIFENQNEIELSVCDNLICANDVHDVNISELTLCQCRKSAITFRNSWNVSIENINMMNLGDWGVIIDKGKNVRVSKCIIEHTGGGGIYADGGNREILETSGIVIENNEIMNIAEWNITYYAGIEICGVGVLVSENKIHHLPHTAVFLSGNNHIIEKNEIYKVCELSNDAGAVYTGRNLSYYGNIIRYNYLHDMNGYKGMECYGLYFDDTCSSAEVYKNIFVNVYYAIMLGGGHDFKIYDNIFYDCFAMVVDSRGDGWYYEDFDNICVARLKNSKYKNEAWKKAYPELYNADVDSKEFHRAHNNRITGNTFIGGLGLFIEKEEMLEYNVIEDNVYISRDAKNKDRRESWRSQVVEEHLINCRN